MTGRHARWGWGALVALGIGCVGWSPHVRELGQVRQDQVIVVGRVAIDPPLREGEQDTGAVGGGRVENKIYVLVDDAYREIEGEPTHHDYEGGIQAKLGKPFYVAMPARDRYVLGASIVVSYAREEMAYFPGGLRIPVQRGDRAIYVGSLIYCRDEFFNVDRALLIDEHARAAQAFQTRFGDDVQLTKRLALPLDAAAGDGVAPQSAPDPEQGIPLHYVRPGTRCADVPGQPAGS